MAVDYMSIYLTVGKALRNVNRPIAGGDRYGNATFPLGDALHRRREDPEWDADDEGNWTKGPDCDLARAFLWGKSEALKSCAYNCSLASANAPETVAVLLSGHYTPDEATAGAFKGNDRLLVKVLSLIGTCHFVPTLRCANVDWMYNWNGRAVDQEIQDHFTRFTNADIQAYAARKAAIVPWRHLQVITVFDCASAGMILDEKSDDETEDDKYYQPQVVGHHRSSRSMTTVLVCEVRDTPFKAPTTLPLLPRSLHLGVVAVAQLHMLGEKNLALGSGWATLPLEVLMYFLEVAFDSYLSVVKPDDWIDEE